MTWRDVDQSRDEGSQWADVRRNPTTRDKVRDAVKGAGEKVKSAVTRRDGGR